MNETMNIAEVRINKLLRDSLQCHLVLKKQKRHELADAVLKLGSFWADFYLDYYGVRKGYYKPKCQHCGRLTVSQADNWSWKSTGLCLSCEHNDGSI